MGPERLERRDLPAQFSVGGLVGEAAWKGARQSASQPAQFSVGSLLLQGTFSASGTTETATGPVEIGFAPTSSESFTPLTIWNGDLDFTTGGDSFDFSGSIEAIEQSTDLSIASIASSQSFSASALTGSGVAIGGGSIAVEGATLTPSNLALVDPPAGNTTNSYVSLQGSLDFFGLTGLSVPVSGSNYAQILPGGTAPGLTLVAAASTSSFQAFGVDLSPASLSVGYSTATNEFQFSGSVGFATSSGDFSASGSLGTPDSPGLVIDDSGDVTQLSITLSTAISTYGLNINADGLTFNYQPSVPDQYTIQSGNITASDSSGDFSFGGAFGSGSTPGVVITDGSLTSLYATLNGTATASGLTLTASNDVLQYNAASGATPAEFEIPSGSISVGTGSSTVSFDGMFGSTMNPGLVLVNGDLQSLDITVSGTINAAGLAINANGLEFIYESATSSFEINTGDVGVTATGFSFTGQFGSDSSPGLTMTGSTLTSVDITVTSTINLQGMTLSVDNLEFSYDTNPSSIYEGDYVIDQGSVSFSTSAGDTTFNAQFGSGVNPGLVIDNGSLSSLYATITSTINAQNLNINAAGLVFQYEGSSDSFEIASGAVSISSGSIEFASATFGMSGAPGLEIQNGVLTSLDITISSNMTVAGLNLNINQLEFLYSPVADETFGNFEIAAGGSVSLSAGSTSDMLSFDGTFGTTDDDVTLPGLSISDGVLQSFYIGITSSINLASSLTLSTTNLTFSYVSATQTFEIPAGPGSVSVVDAAGDFNFVGTFGSTLSDGSTVPGLVVADGSLSELNVSVTSQLTAASLTMNVNAVDFYYNASANQYEIDSGSLSFQTSQGFSFSATFGLPNPSDPSTNLPGLVIVNGSLTEFNASLTSSFTVAGLMIDVDDMAMSYAAKQYEMYGTVTVNTTNVQFSGTIGQPSDSPPTYGLIIENDALQSLSITINTTVTFGSLSLQAQNLAFQYDASPESFTLYGNVSTSIAGVDLQGNLGTQADPGLSIVNGQLATLNLGVTTNFSLFALQCNVQDLTFQYQSSSGNTDYVLYGGLSLSVSGNTFSATMGSADDPGLVIQNGVVEQINMAISGSFQISGFSFDIDDAGIYYTASNDEYNIYGTFTLSDLFSASVQLGTGSTNPGITIIGGVFVLDEFAFSLDNVPIGAFTLNYVDISYDSTGDVWSGAGSVTFPTGWAIAASLTFVNGTLDDISLSYSAGTSFGIEIPDTGMFVTEISASLENLDEPASIIVSGSIQAVFGKEISIGGTSCAIFAATGSFTADSQELIINGGYYEGAYESNGQWTGILGQGTASVDLDWAAGVYTASVSESLYDGTFVLSAELAFNDSGDLGIIATASVNVPDAVPFIGGTQLGSMSFSFLFNASTDSGSVAAWINVNCIFTTVTTGFEYSFNSGSAGSFSLIGAGGVSSIENSFNSITSADASTPPVYVYTYSVTVPSGSGANGVSVQASWPSNDGSQTLLVSGPDDNGTFYSLSSTDLPSTDDFLTSYTTSTSQSVFTSGSSTSAAVALPPGTYTFEVQSTYEFASSSDVTFSNQLYYEAPSIAITSVPKSALAFVPSLTGFAAGALASNTTITLYTSTSNTSYMGTEVASFGYSVDADGNLQNVPSIDLSSYAPGVPIYLYAVINDGTNTAVDSAFSPAIIPVPNLVGTVVDQFGNPLSGIRVFLDLNDDQNYDAPVYSASGSLTTAGDPSVITNMQGQYYFNDLESYQSSDIGYPNFRVMAVMPSPSFTPISPANDVDAISLSTIAPTPNNPTPSLMANFTINRLASITGSLYSDLNQNGVYVASDPSLAGATVYLDMSGDGTYQPNDPTCVTGPSGSYGFYELNPSDYTAGIITSTTTAGVTTNNYIVTQPTTQTYSIPITSDSQQLTDYTFGVISLATVSGTITSQNASGSTPTSLAGTTVDISTPNLSASNPDYSSFASTSGLNLLGPSIASNNSLSMLSSGQSNTRSAAWYGSTLPISGGFATSFTWSMTSTGATSAGLAFVIQSDGATGLGSNAFSYGGLGNSLAVIFDATDNEILIESGGNTSASGAIAVLSSAELGFNLASGSIYTARITYLPSNDSGLGNLNVYLSGDSSGGLTPVLSASLNLASLLNLGSATGATFGFTSGTASTGLSASLSSWSLTALNTESTTTNAQGNYTFTGLLPKAKYTISQAVSSDEIQATPSQTLGSYSESSPMTLTTVDSSVTTGDFNGDGIPDVAYATTLASGAGFQITYAYGNGKGGFDSPVVVNIPLTLTAPVLATPSNGSSAFDAHIVAGDFTSTTHDEIAYIATMAKGGQVIVIYDILRAKVVAEIEVESSAAPLSGSTVTAGYAGTINNVAVGDLNNDGYDDLAVSTYGGVYTLTSLQNIAIASTWDVNPNTLATPLTRPTLYSSSAIAYNAGVAIADFNGDGDNDLISVGVQYIPTIKKSNGESIDSWTNMTVDTSIQLAYGTGNGSNYSVQNQISFQSYTSSNIDVYFSPSSSAPTFPIPFGLAAADVSGDGVPDLVLNGYTSTLQPAVFLLTQTAPGTFTGSNTITIPNGKSFNINGSPGPNGTIVAGSTILPAEVFAADLNGDGFNDIAAVDPNNGQILILTTDVSGLTSGQTQTLLELSGGALPQFALADYSLDGYPDLIVPGSDQYPYQASPTLISNGTINVGTIAYTPTNGEMLTNQDFSDIDFGSTSNTILSASSLETTGVSRALAESESNPLGLQIAGRVFLDESVNSRLAPDDAEMADLVVYIDIDHNGIFNPADDPFAVTNSLGYYDFTNLNPGEIDTIGIANLPSSDSFSPISVVMPASGTSVIVNRDLSVRQSWSLPQIGLTIDPMTPMAIDLAPLSLREALKIRPFYQLIGDVPSGMTIDPESGQILWTPSINYANSNVMVTVEIEDRADRSLLMRQENSFNIHVNAVSQVAAYIRDVYGALLLRLPTADELNDWTTKLDSGTSRLSFVTSIADTGERYTILTNDTYLTVLSRLPTASEAASAWSFFEAGGNSDQLAVQLLAGPEFEGLHPSDADYVNAVNEILAFEPASNAATASEISWLRTGGSRTSLVERIQRGDAATSARANQLSSLYLDGSASSQTLAQWMAALESGSLNTDSLTTHILASLVYYDGAESRPVPNIQASDVYTSPQYNRLDHLEFLLTGSDATRSQLDALEMELYQGESWGEVAEGIYDGEAAATERIQQEFEDLLNRSATASEVASLSRSLPADNQVQALQDQILASVEYRSQFASIASYVGEVYQVLTGNAANAATVRSWTRKLEHGTSATRFVQAVSSSRAGNIEQITRIYSEYLDRSPTRRELNHWLDQPRGSGLKDRTIALKLIGSSEFRQAERKAPLLQGK